MVPYQKLLATDPLAAAFNEAGLPALQLVRLARRRRLDDGGAAGVPVRPAAHLLRDGARRAAAAVGREDPSASTARRTSRRSSPASSWRPGRSIGDAGETYDLTNIGTLFAFALVCIGVLVLRQTDPDRPRPFRVPFVLARVHRRRARVRVRHAGAAARRRGSGSACWLVIGLVLYFFYGYKNSTLRSGSPQRS